MNSAEVILKIIELILQVALVFIAWKALSVWKKETRGRDKYQQSKDLLEYIKKLRFLIYTNKKSWYQIYLNDIFTDKEDFYKHGLLSIAKEKAYFALSYQNLFKHINTRSDIFLEKKIRLALDKLRPTRLERAGTHKEQLTYIELQKDDEENERYLDDNVYFLNGDQDLTIEEYFKNWEILITALLKSIRG